MMNPTEPTLGTNNSNTPANHEEWGWGSGLFFLFWFICVVLVLLTSAFNAALAFFGHYR